MIMEAGRVCLSTGIVLIAAAIVMGYLRARTREGSR